MDIFLERIKQVLVLGAFALPHPLPFSVESGGMRGRGGKNGGRMVD